jgi:putative nucleotidyltransferase with HDIG domain
MGNEMSPAIEELVEAHGEIEQAPLLGRELAVEIGVTAAFLAAALPLAATAELTPSTSLPLLAALVLSYGLLMRIRFTIGFGYTAPTQIVLVPMLLLLPPALVPLLVAAGIIVGNVPDFATGRRHKSRALLAGGDSWHAVGPALVLVLFAPQDPSLSHWPIYLAALGAQFVADFLWSSLRDWLFLGIAPKLHARMFLWTCSVDVLLSPVGMLAALAGQDSPGAALLALPLAGLFALFARERQARIDHALELSRAYRGTTLLLSDVLEADDEYTGLHSRDVVSLALAVADKMGLDPHRRRNLEFGALLHDVGKIAVPGEIINKKGPLTDEEWVVIKAHTVEGQRMLDRVGGVLSDVGAIVRSSHERWDGGGYPDGICGEDIPLESSIVSCCDAFDAMISDRPYRPGRAPEEALEEVLRNSGTQFRPDVVAAVTAVVEQDLRSRGAKHLGIKPGTTERETLIEALAKAPDARMVRKSERELAAAGHT